LTQPTIYLNNAATSWPKPQEVMDSMLGAVRDLVAPPGRSGSAGLASERALFEARERVAGFIGATDSSRVIFTLNATAALNLAITGLLDTGDHVVTTSMDHNSVARPLARAVDMKKVKVQRVPADGFGLITADQVIDSLTPHTKLIILTHASNVTGGIQPVEEVCSRIGDMGAKRPLVLVDAAQSAGVLPIDVQKTGIDLLAVPGHKSLYGPQGTGFLYISPGVELVPLMEGGTGGQSNLDRQPEHLPDRYESGTPNVPGIVALGEAVNYISRRGVEQIRAHESYLLGILMKGLSGIKGSVLFGPCDPSRQIGMLSFLLEGMDPAEIGSFLEVSRGIIVRVGLHCSPSSHRTIGTFPEGTVRVSPGIFNTEDDVLALIEAVRDLQGARGVS